MKDKDVWLISSAPVETGESAKTLKELRFSENLESVFDRISPHGMMVFNGKFDEDNLPIDEWFFQRELRGHTVDARDWECIRSWASSVAEAKEAQADCCT